MSGVSLDGALGKVKEIKDTVLDHMQKEPVITGLALIALGCLVASSAFGVNLGLSLHQGIAIPIGLGLLGLTYAIHRYSKKLEEQDPKQKTIVKTILSAMKILLPALAIGIVLMSLGYGSQFFGSDTNKYAQVAAYPAAMLAVGLGIYSLVTGSIRKRMEKKAEEGTYSKEICVQAVHRTYNGVETLVWFGLTAAFGLSFYLGFQMGSLPTMCITGLVGIAFGFRFFAEKMSDAIRGVRNPLVEQADQEMRKLAKQKTKPTVQPVAKSAKPASEPIPAIADREIPTPPNGPESKRGAQYIPASPVVVDPFAGIRRQPPYSYKGQQYENVLVEGIRHINLNGTWYTEGTFKALLASQ